MSEQLAIQSEKALVPAGGLGVQLQTMEDMYRFATCVLRSGMAPKSFGSPEAILVAMQHGMELGLSPMQAIQSIAVINGRPTIWGDACLALCMGRPDFAGIEETSDGDGDKMTATCTVRRKTRVDVVRRFSVADAKRAGLWQTEARVKRRGKEGGFYETDNDSPWYKYPARMLQMRARGFALRDAFPDALKGIGIREEVQDIPERIEAPAKAVRLRLEPVESSGAETRPVGGAESDTHLSSLQSSNPSPGPLDSTGAPKDIPHADNIDPETGNFIW